MKQFCKMITAVSCLTLVTIFSTELPPIPEGDFNLTPLKTKPDEEMMSIIETCGPVIPITLPEVVQKTITLRPQTQIQVEDVSIQSGIVQQNAGPFDWLVESQYSRTKRDDVFLLGEQTNLDARISTIALQESKKFRVGTEFLVRLDAEYARDPTDLFLPKFSRGTVTFRVLQPVLRGFIYGEDTITELASKYELRAVYYNALHNISDLIRQSLNAYWNVVHGQKLVVVLKESVKSFENLANKTERLIEEDQIARSEINQPLAQLAAEQINLKFAEQRLYSNVQTLKFSMGAVDITCFSDFLLYAANPFPQVDQESDVCRIMKKLNEYAVNLRLDKKASETRVQEFAVLVKGAKNLKLPQVDLFYDHSLTQFKTNERADNLLSGFDMPNPQKDKTFGVIFSYPLGNNEAEGTLRRFKAAWRRQIFVTEELSQQIVAEVMDSWMNHIRLQDELRKAKEASKRFQELTEAENRRLSEGLGSLFNLVDFQTRLTQAKIRETDIERDLSINLTNLHFFTGSLLKQGSNLCSIDVADVTEIPFKYCP